MSPTTDLQDLLDYTAWQRQRWHLWFRQAGSGALEVSTGPHGDGRLPTIGILIRHIFSAELRYTERLRGSSLTDTAGVPSGDIDALFRFGAKSRAAFAELVSDLSLSAWDTPVEFSLLNAQVRATPRKVALHTLTHEIRHWAQVGTMLRLAGWRADSHDLLLSPVQGEELTI